MAAISETKPSTDVTELLTHEAPTRDSVDTLLKYGIVVTNAVVDSEGLEALRRTVDHMYFETIHLRAAYKLFEKILPNSSTRDDILQRHSLLSQFNPNEVPHKFPDIALVVGAMLELDDTFFEDERLREMHAERDVQPNVINVSRATSGQAAFKKHQDSVNVCRLGHALQSTRTNWVVYGGEAPSSFGHNYNFTAEPGSVVTLLERVEAMPRDLPPGQGETYFLEDGSEVHGGTNLTDETRHRLGLFAQEIEYALPDWDSKYSDPLISAVARAVRKRRLAVINRT